MNSFMREKKKMLLSFNEYRIEYNFISFFQFIDDLLFLLGHGM